MAPPTTSSEGRGRNARVAILCAGVFAAMVGSAFAAVPLYRAFCQATGFNGTARAARAAPGAITSRRVTVSFDTNVRGLAWRFEPVQRRQSLRLGETRLAFFRAINTGRAAVTGRAVYNILPQSAGPYFSKLECFCFKNQTIAPGETVEFPVVYFIDPHFADDADTRDRTDVTLSYTFFPAAPAQARAGRPSTLGGWSGAGL